jgi:hypothetical protein
VGKRKWDEGQMDGSRGYTGIVRKGMWDEGQRGGWMNAE